MRDEAVESVTIRRVLGGKGGAKQRVLIDIDGEVEDVLSVEPVIRSLKSSCADNVDITVCARHEELFRNHPGVSRILHARGSYSEKDYDLCYRLGAESGAGSMPKADRYAEQLGVVIGDRRPRVYLDSFDLLRMQRFNLAGRDEPRIVIGAGAREYAKLWDEDKWLELCDLLAGKIGANIIQVGRKGERFFGYGCNLIGKLTAREAATVLKSSDLLISVDNGYGYLAEAVARPGLIMSDAGGAVRIETGGGHCAGIASTMVKDIAIETVLDGVAAVSRREHGRQMERLSCA